MNGSALHPLRKDPIRIDTQMMSDVEEAKRSSYGLSYHHCLPSSEVPTATPFSRIAQALARLGGENYAGIYHPHHVPRQNPVHDCRQLLVEDVEVFGPVAELGDLGLAVGDAAQADQGEAELL